MGTVARMPQQSPARPAVALGDLGDSACGVGNTVAALLDELPCAPPPYIDLAAPLRAVWAAARRVRPSTRTVVVVYPTISTSRRPELLVKVAALRWWFRRGEVRLYLHEFGRLGRKHRAGIVVGLFLTNGRIVVCVPSEARAVRNAAGGWATRGQTVVSVPTINGTAPGPQDVQRAFDAARAAGSARERTVGVFGSFRPDKGPDWLAEVLATLDDRFDRLEFIGSGWDRCVLPESVQDRYDVVLHGHVPTVALAEVFGGWGLALAPFWEGGAHDGRGSLRTPLAYGVPTLTRPPRPGDLELDVPHLLFDEDAAVVASVPTFSESERRSGAEAVAAHEAAAIRRGAAALFDVELT